MEFEFGNLASPSKGMDDAQTGLPCAQIQVHKVMSSEEETRPDSRW